MHKILIACRFGVGTSLLLKIKIENVIQENNLPIQCEHSNLDGIKGFQGEAVFTVIDVAEELKDLYPDIEFYGITNIIDKNEILNKLNMFLEKHQ